MIPSSSTRLTPPMTTSFLIDASSLGDLAAVRDLLKSLSSEEVNRTDSRQGSPTFGLTALHRAKTPEIARLLLEAGASTQARGPLKQTPLHTGCEFPEVVRVLMERGMAEIDARTMDGSTALEWAVVADNLETVKVLVGLGADVQAANDNGNTALHLVCSKRMAQMLLDMGARVSVENFDGKIPLETALERTADPDFAAITELLLEVSEERGLQYRPSKSLLGQENSFRHTFIEKKGLSGKTTSATLSAAGGVESEVKLGGAAKRRWEMIRDKFVPHTQGGGSSRGLSDWNRSRASSHEWHAMEDDDGGAVQDADDPNEDFFFYRTDSEYEDGANEDVDSKYPNGEQPSLRPTTSLTSIPEEYVTGSTVSIHENETTAGNMLPPHPNRKFFADRANTSRRSFRSVASNKTEKRFYEEFFEVLIVQRPLLARKMLDRQRKFLYARGSAKYYSYDLSLLGDVDTSSSAFRLILDNNQRELVGHDLVQWLVEAKWACQTKYQLFDEIIVYIFFMCCFGFSSLASTPVDHETETFASIMRMDTADLLLVLLSLRSILKWVLEWYRRGATYKVARSIFRADKFTGGIYVLVLMENVSRFAFGVSRDSSFSRSLNTLGSVMLWVRVLNYLEPTVEKVGVAIITVRRMISDIFVYIGVQVVFLIGFSHAMTIVFRDAHPPNDSFDGFMSSFTTMGFFIFNLDMDPIYSEPSESRRFMAMCLMAVYESLVVVVFLNLVIAVMADSFDEVMSNSKQEWLLTRAKYALRLEDQAHSSVFWPLSKKIPQRKSIGKTVLVMERASGENEVALPVRFIPEHWIFHLADVTGDRPSFVKAASFYQKLGRTVSRDEETLPLNSTRSSYGTLKSPSAASVPASPSKLPNLNRAHSGPLRSHMGEEEVVLISTYLRSSVRSALAHVDEKDLATIGGENQEIATTPATIESLKALLEILEVNANRDGPAINNPKISAEYIAKAAEQRNDAALARKALTPKSV